MRIRGRGHVRCARVLLAVATALTGLVAIPAPQAVHAETTLRAGCRGPSNSIALADALLVNRYSLASHPVATLPANPAWNEDPFNSRNWEFNYHSLRFVLWLTTAWADTGDQRYLDRATFLLYDWYRDNPRSAPRDVMAWNDHATAWRAMVYVCAAEILPPVTWLTTSLNRHGSTLADSAFYRSDGGNHALNQDVGLLEVGCYLDRADWMSLATKRLTSLVERSVDAYGVSNEQAIYYQLYNYQRYQYARSRFTECGQTLGSAFDRVDRMPLFLAHATMPDGNYVPIGDTQAAPAVAIAGTPAEFTARQGTSGPKPTTTYRIHGAGYAFMRTGWGEDRPYADETMATVRFGPARVFHGHRDGGAVTLYGYGKQLLLDAGMYTIEAGSYRSYFVGRSAHNVVTVDGGVLRTTAATLLRWRRTSDTLVEVALTGQPYSGVTANRRVVFSRPSGYLIVDDQLRSTTSRTFRQLWHLRESSSPIISGTRAWTRAARSNVMIVQVVAPTATRIITGSTSPIQGWISYRVFKRLAAPVVESRRAGTNVRFLTLLVPYESTKPSVTVSNVSLTSTGYSLTVTVDGKRERVVATSLSSSISPLP